VREVVNESWADTNSARHSSEFFVDVCVGGRFVRIRLNAREANQP
jgi:hypothetical protein